MTLINTVFVTAIGLVGIGFWGILIYKKGSMIFLSLSNSILGLMLLAVLPDLEGSSKPLGTWTGQLAGVILVLTFLIFSVLVYGVLFRRYRQLKEAKIASDVMELKH